MAVCKNLKYDDGNTIKEVKSNQHRIIRKVQGKWFADKTQATNICENAVNEPFNALNIKCKSSQESGSTTVYTVNGYGVVNFPDGYTPLEYIKNNGTNVIYFQQETNQDYTLECKAAILDETTSYSTYITSFKRSNDYEMFAIAATKGSSDTILRPTCKVGSTSPGFYITLNSFNEPVVFKYYDRSFYVNNELKYTFTSTFDAARIYIMGFGHYYASEYARIQKLYYYKLWGDNNNLVRDLYPCMRESDGKVGLYDMVSGEFIVQYKGDDFIAGPKIKITQDCINPTIGTHTFTTTLSQYDYLKTSGSIVHQTGKLILSSLNWQWSPGTLTWTADVTDKWFESCTSSQVANMICSHYDTYADDDVYFRLYDMAISFVGDSATGTLRLYNSEFDINTNITQELEGVLLIFKQMESTTTPITPILLESGLSVSDANGNFPTYSTVSESYPSPNFPQPIVHTDRLLVHGVQMWDEVYDNGYYVNGEFEEDANHLCSTNPINVMPNENYYLFCDDSAILSSFMVVEYDKSGEYLGEQVVPKNTTFSTSSETYYIQFYTSATTYKQNITINKSNSLYNGHYFHYRQNEVVELDGMGINNAQDSYEIVSEKKSFSPTVNCPHTSFSNSTGGANEWEPFSKNDPILSLDSDEGALKVTFTSVTSGSASPSMNHARWKTYSSSYPSILGHKYYVCIDLKTYQNCEFYLATPSYYPISFGMLRYPNYTTPNEWMTYKEIITCDNAQYPLGMTVSVHYPENFGVGGYFYFKNAKILDLTDKYGVGNEPTTVEEFENDYYFENNKFVSRNLIRSAYHTQAIKYIPQVSAGSKNTSARYVGVTATDMKRVSNTTNMMSNMYKADTSSTGKNYVMVFDWNDKKILFYNDSFAGVSLYNVDMTGTNLYYELATPIKTDITQTELGQALLSLHTDGDTIIESFADIECEYWKEKTPIPSEYKRVGWVGSKGNALIRTGLLTGANDIDLRMSIMTTETPSVFNSLIQWDTNTGSFYAYVMKWSASSNRLIITRANRNTAASIDVGTQNLWGVWLNFRALYRYGNKVETLYFNNQVANSDGRNSNWEQANIDFFGDKEGGTVVNYFKQRIKYIYLLKGKTVALSYIPVIRKSDNKAGFYDLVSGQFITKTHGTADLYWGD